VNNERSKVNRKLYFLIGGALLFVIYIFGAAKPVPVETVITNKWINSLTSTYPVAKSDAVGLLPFQLGDRFGYVDKDGTFTINRVKKGYVSLSDDNWAEFDAVPDKIEVHNPISSTLLSIDASLGYPVFLDKRTFLVSSEQNAITALDDNRNVLWTYDFASPLTCIDAAADFLLAGSLDGSVEVLDGRGKRVFFFEPGGSRFSIIVGCAFTEDASKIAIVSGIDEQRFLLMERLSDSVNNEYRVVYHEFLGEGFRHPVHVAFVDNDNRVAFEREKGLGLYDIANRKSITLPLTGSIVAIDETGSNRLLFLITAQSGIQKQLVAVKFPGSIMAEAPFKSEAVFLGRQDSVLYIGGGSALAAFEIGNR
jgi:hypothetical protein